MANANSNNGANPANIFNANGTVPYAKIKANVGPYVRSRIWASRVAGTSRGANTNKIEAVINATNKRPTKKMVLLALAQALGVRYTTTGRGGGLEDAPFIPGVAAIPTIQRNLWSTEEAYLPVAEVRKRMEGHWGVDGINISPRNPLNKPANNRSIVIDKPVTGAISSFYHPAFTQVCYGNGEWLINGFKVQKKAIIEKAAGFLGRAVNSVTSGANALIGPAGKGANAAEADITKITIMNWPAGNSSNFSRTRIIFTIGEDKVGPGEGAQAHGKEVAQLRFIAFAIYYMWYEVHQSTTPSHPWKSIPFKNIDIEAVFLAAGADKVQNTIITNQANKEKTSYIDPTNRTKRKIMNVVPVNLDKFCAIFRLDAYRFATAMTAVDAKFRDKMIEYFSKIKELNQNPALNKAVNNANLINVSAGLATLRLNNATLGRKFKPVVLRKPRTNWKNNDNRKAWERAWFNLYKNYALRHAPMENRTSIRNAKVAFGENANMGANNNKASYYSGESAPNIFEQRAREAAFKKNEGFKIEKEQAALAASRAAAAAATAARRAETQTAKNLRRANMALKAAQASQVLANSKLKISSNEKKLAAKRKANNAVIAAKAAYNAAKAANNAAQLPFNKNAYLQSIATSNANFGDVYGKFMRDHANLQGNLIQKLKNLAQQNQNAANKLTYINLQQRGAKRRRV